MTRTSPVSLIQPFESWGKGSVLATLFFVLIREGRKPLRLFQTCTIKTHGIRSHLLHQGNLRPHHSAVWRAGTEHWSSGTVRRSSHPEEGRCQAPETSRTPHQTGPCSRLRRRTSSSLGCTGGRGYTGRGRHCRSQAEASLDLRETHCGTRGERES